MSEANGALAGLEARAAAIHYVEGLQRDGRLLLLFLARRPNRSLDTTLPNPAVDAGHQTAAAYFLLTADPGEVAKDQVKLATLVACVDDLSRRAAPATVSTIRLTAAYVGLPIEDGSVGASGEAARRAVEANAESLRARTNWIKRGALFATLLALILLAYVDNGRRAMNQLSQHRQDYAKAQAEIGRIPPAGWVELTASAVPPASQSVAPPAAAAAAAAAAATETDAPRQAPPESTGSSPALPFCWAKPNERFRSPSNDPTHGVEAMRQCSALYEAALRLNLAFLPLERWNEWRLLRADPPKRPEASAQSRTCPEVGRGCEPEKDLTNHWKRTELRTVAGISLLSSFVLPLLLAFVGGCAFVIRRITEKTADWTLDYQDGAQSLVRVLLATMLGGLLGVVWTGGETVTLSGVTLSLAAAAFFVGFALEVVFSLIEAIVAGVADKMRTQVLQPSGPSPVAAATPSVALRLGSTAEREATPAGGGTNREPKS